MRLQRKTVTIPLTGNEIQLSHTGIKDELVINGLYITNVMWAAMDFDLNRFTYIHLVEANDDDRRSNSTTQS